MHKDLNLHKVNLLFSKKLRHILATRWPNDPSHNYKIIFINNNDFHKLTFVGIQLLSEVVRVILHGLKKKKKKHNKNNNNMFVLPMYCGIIETTTTTNGTDKEKSCGERGGRQVGQKERGGEGLVCREGEVAQKGTLKAGAALLKKGSIYLTICQKL